MGTPRQTPISGSARESALNEAKSRPEKSQKLKNTNSKSRSTEEESVSPQTCCSNCQTVFEVSLELLSTSDTRVRCGECLSVFDALANLRDTSHEDDRALIKARSQDIKSKSRVKDKAGSIVGPIDGGISNAPNINAAALAGPANDTASLDVTYSDFDLFSSDAGLPDIQFSDNTRDIQGFHFDDLSDIDDETFSDTLFAQDATLDARSSDQNVVESQNSSSIALGGDVAFLQNDSHPESLIFNYRDDESQRDTNLYVRSDSHADSHADSQSSSPTPDPGRLTESFESELPIVSTYGSRIEDSLVVRASASGSWIMRGGLFVIALVIAGSLYGYRERDALLNNEVLRPLLSKACGFLSCQLPDQIDINSLRAVDRSVVMHPTVAKALIIKFGIINLASFSQPYPVLEIRLTDRSGRLVVVNRFSPAEYSRGWQQGDVLDKGKRLDIGLVVEDPGNTAMSFELDFHEVK
jgi:predicted Zn finger-like uncharacterized protein